MRGGTSVAVLVAAMTHAAISSAQSEGAAEALFRDGLKLFERGQTVEACAKFKESYRLDAANGTLQNLAACHEKVGRFATAWADWSLLAGRAAAAGQKSREELARRRSAELEKRLYRVRFQVPPGHPATAISVDGSELARGAWTTALPLDPGTHAITFAAEGYVARMKEISVPREPGMVDVAAPPLEKAAPPPATSEPISPALGAAPTEQHPQSSGVRTAAYFAIGVGAAGVVAGGVLGAMAMNAKAGLTGHCDGAFCDDSGLHANDRAHGFAIGSTIAVGVGAAALALGVVLLVVSAPAARGPDRAALPQGVRF